MKTNTHHNLSLGELRRLADWIASHDVYTRITAKGIVTGSHATTREGYPFTEVVLVTTVREAREVLGY
jgi:hypothetical protein